MPALARLTFLAEPAVVHLALLPVRAIMAERLVWAGSCWFGQRDLELSSDGEHNCGKNKDEDGKRKLELQRVNSLPADVVRFSFKARSRRSRIRHADCIAWRCGSSLLASGVGYELPEIPEQQTP